MYTKESKKKVKKPCGNSPSTATLDEAMDLTGIGAFNMLHMLVCGVIMMGVIMQGLVLGYVTPAAQCDLALTIEQRGWLSALPFVAMILTSHLWGWLADTRGRKPVMQYSMLLSVIISIGSSFSPNLMVFAVTQFLSSILYLLLCLKSVPRRRLHVWVVSLSTSLSPSLAQAIRCSRGGPIWLGTDFKRISISWLILTRDFSHPIDFLGINYRPWRLLVVATTIPYAIAATLLIFTPESPKFLNCIGRLEDCLDVVKSIYSFNKRLPKDSFSVKTLISENQVTNEETKTGLLSILASMRDQTVPLFKAPLLKWTLLTCFVQFGLFSSANGFYVWFPTILNALAEHDNGDSSICQILSNITTAPVNGTQEVCDDTINSKTFEHSIYLGVLLCCMYIIVGVLVDIIGKKIILVVVLGTSGICGMITHSVAANIGVILFAIFQASGACIGLMNAVAVGLFPTKFRAMALCLAMMMGRVGSVVASNFIALLLKINCGAGFYLFGTIMLVCALLCFTLPANKKVPSKTLTVETTQNEADEPV